MRIIFYDQRPVVYVTDGRAHLAPRVGVLESDHPLRRWAVCLGYLALCVDDGAIAGEFVPARAEHYARCVLMPAAEFAARMDWDDVSLAEHFAVPLEQVAERFVDFGVAAKLGITPG